MIHISFSFRDMDRKGVLDYETKGERRVMRNKSAKIALKRLCRKCLKDKFFKKHMERCQRCENKVYQKKKWKEKNQNKPSQQSNTGE